MHRYDKTHVLLSIISYMFPRLLHHHQGELYHILKNTVTLCCYIKDIVNLLKPTGQVMHQQFNIQQLYVLPILYLCVLYLSENKQRLVPLTA